MHQAVHTYLAVRKLTFMWLSEGAGMCRGLHFLVVQKDEEAEECAGLWLLQNRDLPSV